MLWSCPKEGKRRKGDLSFSPVEVAASERAGAQDSVGTALKFDTRQVHDDDHVSRHRDRGGRIPRHDLGGASILLAKTTTGCLPIKAVAAAASITWCLVNMAGTNLHLT